MNNIINARVQHKIDSYENWNNTSNFTPLTGEIIIYTTDEKNNEKIGLKIGDGITDVKALNFLPSSGIQFITWEDED